MKKQLRECLTNPNIFNKDVKMKTNIQFTSPNSKFNLIKEYHDNLKKMNEFERKSKRILAKIQDSSSDTNMFVKYYSNLNGKTKRDMIVHSLKLSPFKDILFEYHKRKVKPPLITENKNLFKISPLINSHSQVEKYFQYYKKTKNKDTDQETQDNNIMVNKDKNLEYLERVNKRFNDYKFNNKTNEIKAFSQTSNKPIKIKLTKRTSNILNMKLNHKYIEDNNEIEKENQMLSQYNQNLEKMLLHNTNIRFIKREKRNKTKTQELLTTTNNLETRSTRYNTHDYKHDIINQRHKNNSDLLDKVSNFIHYKKGNSNLRSFTKRDLETTYHKVKKLNMDSFSLDLPQKTLYLIPFDSNAITKDLKELKLKIQSFELNNIPKIKQSYINFNIHRGLDQVNSIKRLDSEIASFEQVYTEKFSKI